MADGRFYRDVDKHVQDTSIRVGESVIRGSSVEFASGPGVAISVDPVTKVISFGASSAVYSGKLMLRNMLCDPTVFVGAALYMTAAGVLTNTLATTASILTSRFIGFCEEKVDISHAHVTIFGETDDIFIGLTPGSLYYLSPTSPGDILAVRPVAPYISLDVGIATSSTRIVVQKGLQIIRS